MSSPQFLGGYPKVDRSQTLARVLEVHNRMTVLIEKISLGKKLQVTKDFMIIKRIKTHILKKGIGDTLRRAAAYIEAGADAIMIHNKEKNPREILDLIPGNRQHD